MIYHITLPSHFEKYKPLDYYEAESLAVEGFIHCSTLDQLKATVERYYSQAPEIIMLFINERYLLAPLKYEKAKNGEMFPHIYGAINKEAIATTKVYTADDGKYIFGELFIS